MNPKVTDVIMKTMTLVHTTVYKVSKGRFGNKMKKAPVLFLTVTGRKTGKLHTVPLLYLEDGDRKVIVASKGGDNRHPVWYLNLVANPEVKVEMAGERADMKATVVGAEEKATLWPRLVEIYPGYAGYQRKTERDIPLIALTRS
jgi:deazaflavin-dependent oxidoreductase (nitroreductase family)